MSKKPTLEEVNDDIDNMDMDIAEFDPSLNTPIAPLRQAPTVIRSQDAEMPLFPNIQQQQQPQTHTTVSKDDIVDPKDFTDQEREELQSFQIVYPCYFDVSRSHKQGRRVSKDAAVRNPLAKTVSDACRFFNIPGLLELDKTHPQDFGNPGRVRVMLKDSKTGRVVNSRFTNKRFLLKSIAQYLKDHPTTLELIGPKSGIALPEELQHGFEPEEIPQVEGFKMNSIVPVHSQYTLKHPMTKSIYDPEPELEFQAPIAPKAPKKKVMKIRG